MEEIEMFLGADPEMEEYLHDVNIDLMEEEKMEEDYERVLLLKSQIWAFTYEEREEAWKEIHELERRNAGFIRLGIEEDWV